MRAGKKARREDRRYKNTEKSLLKRTLSLLLRRGGRISVREVCTGVRVGRKSADNEKQKKSDFRSTTTFYNHYRDIDDAIEQMEAKLLQEFAERLEKLERGVAVEGDAGLSSRRILAESLEFIRQNRQVFIVTAKCWRLGTFEEIFKLIYPYVSRDFPNYIGAAAQEQLFWEYLGQNVAVVMAWVRQTGCDVDDEGKCLAKLLAVQRQMGRYLREVGVADYGKAQVVAADLPKNVRDKLKDKNEKLKDRVKTGEDQATKNEVRWWRKDERAEKEQKTVDEEKSRKNRAKKR